VEAVAPMAQQALMELAVLVEPVAQPDLLARVEPVALAEPTALMVLAELVAKLAQAAQAVTALRFQVLQPI